MKKALIILAAAGLVGGGLFFGGYMCWNTMSPDTTCASCHEIRFRVDRFHQSAHRELACSACHGTALSGSVHSLVEKIRMIVTHVSERPMPEDIRMNEKQVLQVNARCIECHASEAAKWRAGGHAATYKDIFLDPEHNRMEAPYPDCLRCHGMYYDGTIKDLMEPLDRVGPWRLKDPGKSDEYTIPCLACHEMHAPNPPMAEYVAAGTSAPPRNAVFSFYSRADKMHLHVDRMVRPRMVHHGRVVLVSEDPAYNLCIRCHSPNYTHQIGTEDDRTPVGVHEGISCIACHDPHSNDTRASCVKCHPAISNCKRDVLTMDTTFANSHSSNNIHFVSCKDCHPKRN